MGCAFNVGVLLGKKWMCLKWCCSTVLPLCFCLQRGTWDSWVRIRGLPTSPTRTCILSGNTRTRLCLPSRLHLELSWRSLKSWKKRFVSQIHNCWYCREGSCNSSKGSSRYLTSPLPYPFNYQIRLDVDWQKGMLKLCYLWFDWHRWFVFPRIDVNLFSTDLTFQNLMLIFCFRTVHFT